MNLLRHPELLDQVAASYALGTLRGGARRRFEAMAREQAPVRAAALIWQTRLASISELQREDSPSPVVWRRIENLVSAEREQQRMAAARTDAATAVVASPRGGWWHSLGLWRGLTAAAALAAVAAIVVGVQRHTELGTQLGGQIAALQARLQAAPQIEYVAVLQDDKATASVLVTFDPKTNRLTLKRVGGYQEASDKSLQLWALPPGAGPRSLGVMGGEPVMRLPATEGDVRAVPALAISLEPRGGAPAGSGPTGPVLFTGALLQTTP
jgi:anti-sigma-K factor RskA